MTGLACTDTVWSLDNGGHTQESRFHKRTWFLVYTLLSIECLALSGSVKHDEPNTASLQMRATVIIQHTSLSLRGSKTHVISLLGNRNA